MLKERLSKNGGNLEEAIGSTMGFVIAGMFASTMLESAEEGAKMPGGLPFDYQSILTLMDDKLNQFCEEKCENLSEYPYEFTYIRINYRNNDVYFNRCFAATGLYAYYDKLDGDTILRVGVDGSVIFQEFCLDLEDNTITKKDTGLYKGTTSGNYIDNEYMKMIYFGNIPVCNTLEESLSYYDNPYPVYPDTYINPSTIGKSTALAKKLAETGGNLTESLYKNATLPTTEQLNQYFEDLNNAENEEEKQKVMDEFVDSLVTPAENPNPNPNPNPDPDKPDKPDNPDNPTNNDTFLADLKHLFPFCIPFDLVDCFKLFNAEPVTPRVEFPVHFGIINYDHTFVIDLKDFDKVAVVCRSTFLIIYMTGLILATRALIKG